MQNYDLEYDLEAIKNNPILADLLKWQSINAYNDYNRDVGAFFNDLGRYGFSTVFDCGTLDNSELAQVVFYILDNDINCNNETGMDTINILANDHILREQLSKFILYTLKPHIKNIMEQM